MSVKNIDELIARLGGPALTASVLGTQPHAVQNWKKHGHIPARLFKVHRKRLEPFGIKTKDTVWGFATE